MSEKNEKKYGYKKKGSFPQQPEVSADSMF